MKYVTCDIMGGIGNQLFQIFTVIAYAIKHNWIFVFPYFDEIEGFTPRRFTAWNHFLKDLKQYTTADKRNDMIAGYISNFPVYREPGFKFTEIPCNNNFMFLKLIGYFQSYKYFDKYFDKISKMINLDQQIKDVNDNNKELLADEYNISMHFRIGDYKMMQAHHPLMPYKYYFNSLKYILKLTKEEKTKVIYFCEKEDIEFVNETIAKLKLQYKNLEFIRASDEIPDWQQMLLMSCCDANIIANSSFSWWGAYFNNKQKKVICYPNIWFGRAQGKNDISDLIPSTWKKINTREDEEY